MDQRVQQEEDRHEEAAKDHPFAQAATAVLPNRVGRRRLPAHAVQHDAGQHEHQRPQRPLRQHSGRQGDNGLQGNRQWHRARAEIGNPGRGNRGHGHQEEIETCSATSYQSPSAAETNCAGHERIEAEQEQCATKRRRQSGPVAQPTARHKIAEPAGQTVRLKRHSKCWRSRRGLR